MFKGKTTSAKQISMHSYSYNLKPFNIALGTFQLHIDDETNEAMN